MFTGIVEEIGRVESFDDGRLRIAASTVLAPQDGATVKLGDSIAVSGCCLTLVDQGPGWWEADVSAETLARTSLRSLAVGSPVNLERAVRLVDRLGGHLVQGHVDGVGQVIAVRCVARREVQHEIDGELLAVATLVVEHAVVPGAADAGEEPRSSRRRQAPPGVLPGWLDKEPA